MSYKHSSHCLRALLRTTKVQAAATLLRSLMYCLACLSSPEAEKTLCPGSISELSSCPRSLLLIKHVCELHWCSLLYFCRKKDSCLFFPPIPSTLSPVLPPLGMCRGPPAPGPWPPHYCEPTKCCWWCGRAILALLQHETVRRELDQQAQSNHQGCLPAQEMLGRLTPAAWR